MTSLAPKGAQRVRSQGSANGGFGVRKSGRLKRQREAADIGVMVARMIRALRVRAEAGDLEALVALVALDRSLTVETKRAARELHALHAYSWAQISLRLGVAKSTLHEKWGGGEGS